MTIGINNRIEISYTTVATIYREVVEPERVTTIAHALGIVSARESDVYIFKNYNYKLQLNRLDLVKNGDIIEIIDRVIFDKQNTSHKDRFRLEQDIINIKNIINDLRTRTDNEEEITYLELLLATKQAEFESLFGVMLEPEDPILTIPEPPSNGTDSQTITVSWNAEDGFANYAGGPFTGPSGTKEIIITINTENEQPTESEIVITIVVDGGTMIENTDYILIDFEMTLPIGTINGYSYIATYESYDDGIPDTAIVTLTAVGATPIGDTIVEWSPVV